jgi:ketosteroid isomerase-like protein
MTTSGNRRPRAARLATMALALATGGVTETCTPAPQGESPGARTSSALDSARALLASVPTALGDRGPAAWLDFFEDTPSFFMASDGAIAFADRVTAETFLDDFSRKVSGMVLEWHQPRFEDLGGDIVAVTASYDETIRMRDGTESSFGGHMSGVIRRQGGRWRFQHLHWSSPAGSAR